VQKSRLIEKIAELLQRASCRCSRTCATRAPRTSASCWSRKSRTVDAGAADGALFRSPSSRARIPLNMNVLDAGKVPKVMSLREVLRAWLDHRREVLVRRSRTGSAEIDRGWNPRRLPRSPISTSTR
jgi:topoisomerase-4 subunit A